MMLNVTQNLAIWRCYFSRWSETMASNTGSIGDIRKKFHKLHDLISTSYHEAGHTVYGLLHGLNIESVFVFETKKTKRINGFTQYDPFDLDEIQDLELRNNRAQAEVGLYYAGLIAEKRLFKMISGLDKFPMFLKDGSSVDVAEAAFIMEKYGLAEAGKKRYNYKKKIIKSVDKQLIEHWDAVTIVAHALIKKKKLNYNDLSVLLLKKANDREFWKKQLKIHHELCNNSEHLDEKDIKYILSL